MSKTMEERFWEKVERADDEDDCWEWTGARSSDGYGQIKVDGRNRQAHRVSFELENGVEVGDDWVLHHCDNKPCVNPNHLYQGSPSENLDDAYERNVRGTGGPPPGSEHPNSKLTEEGVQEIKRRLDKGEPHVEIAEDFPVTADTIDSIAAGKRWQHVEYVGRERP